MLIMTSFTDFDIICIGSMIGRETHELGVSFGGEDSHTFCIACSNRSMRGNMATTAKHYFAFIELDHVIEGMPYGDDFISITYGMICAIFIYSIGEEIFGDLFFILPLEGNYLAAQDQPTYIA